MYGRGFGRAAPIRVGEEFDVKIESVGEKGDGVAKVQGFVLFVPGVKKGDEVRVRVTRVSSKFGFAEVVGGEKAEQAEPVSEEGPEEEPEEEKEEAQEQEKEGPEEEEEPPADTEDFGEDLA
jgi:predicted RNA-binding protein with TRAM domain